MAYYRPAGEVPPQRHTPATDLLAGLFDDAALFPPGNAPMEQAVPAHAEHRTAWYADLVGPFLCPGTALPRLLERLPEERPLRLGLIEPTGGAGLGPALAAIDGDARVTLVAVEVAAAGVEDAVRALDAHLPRGVAGYVEVPRGPKLDAALDVLAATPYRAKFRTGGTVAEAFPPEPELAAFLTGCLARGLPFKCTAGLHHAVRHTAPDTGFEHHGFLNVLLAVAAVLDGADPSAVLGERSGEALAARAARLPAAQARAVREHFLSFGTCSIAEPLDDLLALGLLARP